MRQLLSSLVVLLVASALAGCSESGTDSSSRASAKSQQASGADKAVHAFLDAVRRGDDKKASALLTDLARKRTEEVDMVVAPPGSDSATFEISEVEAISDGEAHVLSKWTDLDADGKPYSDEIVWLLKRQGQEWRIYGMATRLFVDSKPVLLNFEDPQDMIHKQQMAEQEMMRRANEQKLQAESPNPAADASRQ